MSTTQEKPNIQPPATTPKKRLQKKNPVGRIVATLLIFSLLIGGGYALYLFLTASKPVSSSIQSGYAQYSSIQSTVQGSGSTRAKESAAITLSQSGVVQDVYVSAGDVVFAGQPLYTIYSPSAEDAVASALEVVTNIQSDLKDLNAQKSYLTVSAPFSGKLIEVETYTPGVTIYKGTQIATLVNDQKLKLSLYYSYGYENEIFLGQDVTISIPSVMGSFDGIVDTINKVHYISPEGANHFEVIVSFDNPGTLTQGMVASASMTASDGSPIYPYESQTTEYYESRGLITQTDGPFVSANLLRYAKVTKGQTLLTLGSDTLDEEIKAKQVELATANEALATARTAMGNFNAVSPIDGTITTCTLTEGADVSTGETVIIISNNTNMLVDITVDDRNIGFVVPGMYVELTDWNRNSYYGTVTSINMGDAQAGQGMTQFPVTLSVDNGMGTLMEGVWLDYSFVASQSEHCILVPMQSVKYVSDVDGNTFSVVFIKSNEPPENMVEIDLPPSNSYQVPSYPSTSDGYYPVRVGTGLSDNYNVEITDGLFGGEEVFMSYFVDQAWG